MILDEGTRAAALRLVIAVESVTRAAGAGGERAEIANGFLVVGSRVNEGKATIPSHRASDCNESRVLRHM
ncbi:hypothetical protein ABZ470_27595 [Streptosporangium sp. NPDC020072]|uniref:hypothetical protein n=1 Tax=Streptosporangium sp. NPDC020072 TaxID=3154788 RepID=UPI00343CAC40